MEFTRHFHDSQPNRPQTSLFFVSTSRVVSFPFRHPNLELVRGDACELESFSAALEGKDAVISCLGVFASIFNPTTFYSESMFAILEGMKRFVTVSILRRHYYVDFCTR